MKIEKIVSEDRVINAILNWAYKNSYGLKPKIKHGHKHGVDLELNHEKTRHKYYIACKGGPHHEVNFVFSVSNTGVVKRFTPTNFKREIEW